MRKVDVDVKVRLIIRANEGQDIEEVLENMDYDFTASPQDNADIEYTEILEWDIKDSR